MSKIVNWYMVVQDIEELFQSTFGPEYDFSVEGVEFDEVLGTLKIEILKDVDSNDPVIGNYVGVRIA